MSGAVAAQMTPGTRLVATLGLVALFSGLLVVFVWQTTLPLIAENQRIALERAVFEVIPGAVERRELALNEAGLFLPGEAPAGSITVHAGFDADGGLRGIAASGVARGYQEQIRVLWGYDPACECIVGMQVVESKETPGIGDRVERPPFTDNFTALDARLNRAGTALTNPIVTVRPGQKRKPWQIDAVSGATITARAVGQAVNDSAEQLLPLLRPHLDTLRRAP